MKCAVNISSKYVLCYLDKWLANRTVLDKFNLSYSMDRSYFPSHARFGPFVVGGVLACNVILANLAPPKPTMLGAVASWVFTLLSACVIYSPLIPRTSLPPVYMQLAITASIRTLICSGAALLLYRTLVPKDHAWHWSLLNAFWSLPIWTPIALVSYSSYLVHYRFLQEINFNASWRAALGLELPSGMEPSDAHAWCLYILKLFAVGFLISLPFSTALYQFVEKPFDAYIRSLLDGGAAKKKLAAEPVPPVENTKPTRTKKVL